MKTDRFAGSAKKTKGTVKDTIGKVTADDNRHADGKADKAKGKVQSAIGGMMLAVRDALKI
jgi:uncharacterized protein YjbJ (UPF0337 family)